jgi:hypothetical protein
VNVDDLTNRLRSLRADRPVRVIDENASGPLNVSSGVYVVDVAYENECAFIITRDRDADEQRYTVGCW